jgi:integrase
VLGKALREGLRHALVSRNVASLQPAPRIDGGEAGDAAEMKILSTDQQRAVLAGLAGKSLYPLIVTALYTGLRRGELLALRWRNVELDAKVLRVRESLENTKVGGIRFKTTKTRAGRRDVSLPDFVVDTLREHRRQQLELRVALGLGKLAEDALVFATFEGEPLSLNGVSKAWAQVADDCGVGDVTLHGLRHTHASQLIDAGVDIVTISKRLGHASPAITMKVYAHLFQQTDAKAAEAINAALAGLGQK